jgi:hypothetical protein
MRWADARREDPDTWLVIEVLDASVRATVTVTHRGASLSIAGVLIDTGSASTVLSATCWRTCVRLEPSSTCAS